MVPSALMPGADITAATVRLLDAAGAKNFGLNVAWIRRAGPQAPRQDMDPTGVLGPLGIAPLVIPPILVAMGFADFAPASGFWFCALLLGTSYAPFVAVLTARGLRGVDGGGYGAAMLSRGRRPAEPRRRYTGRSGRGRARPRGHPVQRRRPRPRAGRW